VLEAAGLVHVALALGGRRAAHLHDRVEESRRLVLALPLRPSVDGHREGDVEDGGPAADSLRMAMHGRGGRTVRVG
jgi:hypothetical protein